MSTIAGIPVRDAAKRGQRVVVCAACRYKDGTLLVGPRHFDQTMHVQRGRLNLGPSYSARPDQGFIDQWGVFMSRLEAWDVAEAAGQIKYRCGSDGPDRSGLFSENLY